MLNDLRRRCQSPSDAVRWACVLEATAPKAGNVYPGRSFEDLSYTDFVRAADVAAAAFGNPDRGYAQMILDAECSIQAQIGTNVNLGILLLLGPLAAADRMCRRGAAGSLRDAVVSVLGETGPEDSADIYRAIRIAHPGGMGEVEDMDLRDAAPDDLIDAMSHAASRDRIALNYARGFEDLFEQVVPVVRSSVERSGDVLGGVALAHLRLLSSAPDSLIRRKFGEEVAAEVQRKAGLCLTDADAADPDRSLEFDRYLRTAQPTLTGEPSRKNPGTTADLIAAALYVLLRAPE